MLVYKVGSTEFLKRIAIVNVFCGNSLAGNLLPGSLKALDVHHTSSDYLTEFA